VLEFEQRFVRGPLSRQKRRTARIEALRGAMPERACRSDFYSLSLRRPCRGDWRVPRRQGAQGFAEKVELWGRNTAWLGHNCGNGQIDRVLNNHCILRYIRHPSARTIKNLASPVEIGLGTEEKTLLVSSIMLHLMESQA